MDMGIGEQRTRSKSKGRRTELRCASQQASRRLAKKAADREWRLFLTTKFERTWRGLTRFRAKVGAACFRDLMADVPDALEEIRSPNQRGVAQFHLLLGGDDFRAFLSELTDALESGSDPGGFWVKWIDVHGRGDAASDRRTEGDDGIAAG